MSIRFAAAPLSMAAFFGCLRVARSLPHAANDNGNGNPRALDPMLCDALRHFAEYGLGAAAQARHEAESCHARGDFAGFADWLEICRQLDRRMARNLERKLAAGLPGTLR